MELRSPTNRDIVLGAIVPNRSTRALYTRQLEHEVKTMAASYAHWLGIVYPRVLAQAKASDRVVLAQDAASRPTAKGRGKNTDALFVELKRLDGYWSARTQRFAEKTATRMARTWIKENTIAWEAKLKRKGFAIKLQLTERQQTFFKVKVQENVALIKSIQKQYHTDVEGIVSRGFLAGRDLATVSEALTKRYGISTRRAALIARDQANKATAQLNATRQDELGLHRATWIHSHAGVTPRPDHERAGREGWEYDTRVGIDFGDGFGFVQPGEAIGCRCTGRSIIPALNRYGNANYALKDLGKFKGVLVPLPKIPNKS